MVIDEILDQKTTQLLIELRKDFEISFQERDIPFCQVFTLNKKCTINYNPKIVDNESIVHELLHVWLSKFNYFIGNHIYLSCQSHKKLSKIFTKVLCDYIENCLDHFKMYPKYAKMGYAPEKFIINGGSEKCSIEDIKSLRMKFIGTYYSVSVNKFIGYLISIYADHIVFDYSEHLSQLRLKDEKLFDIVTDFWKSWVQLEIENIDTNYSDLELSEKFINDMEQWVEIKSVA